MTFSVSPLTRDHVALKWIIRGTGLVIALSSLIFFVCFFGSFIMMHAGSAAHVPGMAWFSMVLIGSVMVLLFSLFAMIGYDMFRQVNSIAVENFSFILALLSARAFYKIMPRHFLREMAGNGTGNSSFLSPHHPDYLWLLAVIAFFILRSLYLKALLRVLDLRADGRPRQPWPSSSTVSDDIPEFPKKSPLIQL